MFAEFERDTIIDRIHRGNQTKLKKGIPLSSRVGYGLKLTKQGRIKEDAATIGVVERIFTEYARRSSGFRAIADGLNADHIPSPSGAQWSPQSVANVLRNRAFAGEVRHRDKWLPGAHKPIIDTELFEAAQTLLGERSARGPSKAALRGDFVLTGLVTCARCGGAYVGTSGTSKTKVKVRYYSCGAARKYGSKHCAGPSLPAEELEKLVSEALLDSYADSALFTEAIEHHLATQADAREPLQRELRSVQQTLGERQRVLRRYRDDYEAGSSPQPGTRAAAPSSRRASSRSPSGPMTSRGSSTATTSPPPPHPSSWR